MMKRGKPSKISILFFFGLILTSFLTSYVLTCPYGNDDLIMKLSSESNAHAELWNQSNYGVEICYSEIFEHAPPSNPHKCKITYGVAENEVVALSAESNAHAEEKRCYLGTQIKGEMPWNGDMYFKTSKSGTQTVVIKAKGQYYNGWPIMQLKINGNVIQEWNVSSADWEIYSLDNVEISGNEIIVSFINDAYGGSPSQDRNLYIDYVEIGDEKIEADSENVKYCIAGLNNYPIKVCYGDLICTMRPSCNPDEKLVVSLSAGTNAHLSKNTDYGTLICCKSASAMVNNAYWANMRGENIIETDVDDRVMLVWEIAGHDGETATFEIHEKGLVDCSGGWADATQTARIQDGKAITTWKAKLCSNGESDGVYFNVSINGEYFGGSNTLTIRTLANNGPPYAKIVKPKIAEIYFVGETINFTQVSYDNDSSITYTWDFGDGNSISGSTDPEASDYMANYNTTHSYTEPGQKTITLTVRDEQGLTATDRTSILVIDSNLSSGQKYVFAHITEPPWGKVLYAKNVFFSGNLSYGIETSNGEINCLGGACPAETVNGTTIKDPNNKRNDYSEMNFTWEFDDGTLRKVEGGYSIYKFFANIGEHWANLKVSINPTSEATTQFTIIGNEEGCAWINLDNVLKPYYIDSNGNLHDPTSEVNYCNITDGGRGCCPFGYSCRKEQEGWVCVIDEQDKCSTIHTCSDYTTKEECEQDNCGVALCGAGAEGCTGGALNYDNCTESIIVHECKCVWDEEKGKCVLSKNNTESTSFDGRFGSVRGIWALYNKTECRNNIMTICFTCTPDQETIIDLDQDCLNSICSPSSIVCRNYACGSLIKLGFMTLKEMIAALVVIAMLYIICVVRIKSKRSKLSRGSKHPRAMGMANACLNFLALS